LSDKWINWDASHDDHQCDYRRFEKHAFSPVNESFAMNKSYSTNHDQLQR